VPPSFCPITIINTTARSETPFPSSSSSFFFFYFTHFSSTYLLYSTMNSGEWIIIHSPLVTPNKNVVFDSPVRGRKWKEKVTLPLPRKQPLNSLGCNNASLSEAKPNYMQAPWLLCEERVRRKERVRRNERKPWKVNELEGSIATTEKEKKKTERKKKNNQQDLH